MRREYRERFPRHRGLAIPTCIISFEVGGGENVPGIPGVCATHIFMYLARGPWTRGYIPLFYEDVITYPCTNSDAGLANRC